MTVTDTRTDGEIPAEVAWYVGDTITDFVGDSGRPGIIAADSFGWTREIISRGGTAVASGDPAAPGEGFAGSEIVASTFEFQFSVAGEWTANARLVLEVPATLTLSVIGD